MEDRTLYWTILILFLAANLAIGYFAFTRSKSLEDFYIGGRKIGVWALAFTYVATWNSAVTYIGFPGTAYKYGMPMVASGVLSAMFAGIFGWLLLARKLRHQSFVLKALTIPEYIERRYQSHGARMLSTITILFFTGIYLVAQYAGVAYILQLYLGLPYGISVVLMAVVMAVYTALGGFLAVVWTDLLCGLAMTLLSLFLFVFALVKLGGWHEIFYTAATAVGPQYNEIPGLMGIVMFSYLAFYTLGSLGSPQLIVRFFSIKDHSVWRKAILLTAVVLAVQTPFMAFMGISVRVAEIKSLIPAGIIGTNTDFALPAFMIHVAPLFAKLLYLVGVTAASMSTANSLLLVASTAIGRDLLQQGIKLPINDNQVRWITSIAALAITLITALLSLNKLPMVVLISAMQLSISGASFMPALIFGIWWKRGTRAGALASMSVGLILPVLLFTVLKPYNIFGHPFWPSLICSFVTYYAVSLYTRPLPGEHLEALFSGER
ncbi:MAG: sodium/solute symporter [Desulfovibrio sp.]|jgi:SSS family transporter|nr:sodium/solute symporter [Desulfovibrio sp.]